MVNFSHDFLQGSEVKFKYACVLSKYESDNINVAKINKK